jgi:hypothetical protein
MMERLARKFETARAGAEAGVVVRHRRSRSVGIIAFGTSHFAVIESRDQLKKEYRLRPTICACARIRLRRRSRSLSPA